MKLKQLFLLLLIFVVQSYNIFSAQIFGPDGLRQQIITYEDSLVKNDYDDASQKLQKIGKLQSDNIFKASTPLRSFLNVKGLYNYVGNQPFPLHAQIGTDSEKYNCVTDLYLTLQELYRKIEIDKQKIEIERQAAKQLKEEIEKLTKFKDQFEVAQNNAKIEAKNANEAMIIAMKITTSEETAKAAAEKAQEYAANAKEFLDAMQNSNLIELESKAYIPLISEKIEVLKKMITATIEIANEASNSASEAKTALLIKVTIKEELKNLRVELSKLKKSTLDAKAMTVKAVQILPKVRTKPIEEAKSLLKELEDLEQKVEKLRIESEASSEKIKGIAATITSKMPAGSVFAKENKNEIDKLMQHIENAQKDISKEKGVINKILKQARNSFNQREEKK